MTIGDFDENGNPRVPIRAKHNEFTAGSAEGTYVPVAPEKLVGIASGSDIIIYDRPRMILFWDLEDGVAYDWTPRTSSS